jgi:hypothetical protein
VLNIAPSGAVTPENTVQWWDAGAVVVGLGSNLAGSDINYDYGLRLRNFLCRPSLFLEDTEEYRAANKKWNESGKAVAQKLFDQVAARFK